MWREARKQEKMIRGMMVDYQRRAERRRDFYEKVKKDPLRFLVIHGSSAQVHIDADLSQQAEKCMMNWQGEQIDRFDGRSQLDFFQERRPEGEEPLSIEERRLNYERYRILVQNSCSNINEADFLHQIEIDEKSQNELAKTAARKKRAAEEKAKLAQSRAAIGFSYADSTDSPKPNQQAKRWDANIVKGRMKSDRKDSDDSSDNETKQDMDVTIDLSRFSKDDLSTCNHSATYYGLGPNDFVKFLREDKREADQLSKLKEEEEEKARYAGRHNRRERRHYKERKWRERAAAGDLVPEFALYEDDDDEDDEEEDSDSSESSSSLSSVDEGKIEYISSFGEGGVSKPSTGNSSDNDGNGGIVCQATTSGVDAVVIGPMPPPPDFKPEIVEERPERRSYRRRESPVFFRSKNGSPQTSRMRARSSSSSSASRSPPSLRRRNRSPSPYRRDNERRRFSSNSGRRGNRRSPIRRRSRNKTRSRSRSRDRYRTKPSSFRRRSPERFRRRPSRSSSSSSTTSTSSTSSSSSTTSSRSSFSKSKSRSRSRSRGRNRRLSPKRRRSLSGSRRRSLSTPKKTPKSQKASKKPLSQPSSANPNSSLVVNKPKQPMSVQEAMRQRVQQALAKQCKADKKAEKEKQARQAQEELERQEKLAKLSTDLQRRDEERRRQELEATSVSKPPVTYTEEDQVYDPDVLYPPEPASSDRGKLLN